MNQVNLLGRIGQNPELKTFDSGSCICNFSIATNRSWKNKEGEKQTETTWHNCSAWGKLGETINKFFSSGSEIAITGRIETQSWENDNGEKRQKIVVIVESFYFTGGSTPKDKIEEKTEVEPF